MSIHQVERSLPQTQKFHELPLFCPQTSIYEGLTYPAEDQGEEWRSNKMLEDDDLEGLEVPQLAHVTSFELACIEDYGKQLANKYTLYIDHLPQACSPNTLEEMSSPLAFEKEENLLGYISQTEAICQDDKTTLFNALDNNLEGKEVLMAISHSVPSSLLPGALILGSVIFKQIDGLNPSNNLPKSLQIIEPDVMKSAHEKLALIGLAYEAEDSKEQVDRLVDSWMKIIDSVLKGVYVNPLRKKTMIPVSNLKSSQSSSY